MVFVSVQSSFSATTFFFQFNCFRPLFARRISHGIADSIFRRSASWNPLLSIPQAQISTYLRKYAAVKWSQAFKQSVKFDDSNLIKALVVVL